MSENVIFKYLDTCFGYLSMGNKMSYTQASVALQIMCRQSILAL